MVLVDTRSERVDAATSKAETAAFKAMLESQATMLSLARRFGIARLLGARGAHQPLLPPGVTTEMVLLQTQPKSLNAMTQEGLARSADDAALAGMSLGSIPLVVIAASDSMAGIPNWVQAQRALAALSPEGRLVVAKDSSHLIQIDQPGIVIKAFQSVLAAVRGDQ